MTPDPTRSETDGPVSGAVSGASSGMSSGMPTDMYGPDLARMHDARFGAFAEAAGAWLAAELAAADVRGGGVVDLGCGGGVLLDIVTRAGFEAHGVDLSPDMIALARARIPEATFEIASCYEARLPPAVAVTAIGEVLCYRQGSAELAPRRRALFASVAAALRPGGIFAFDILETRGAAADRALERTGVWEVEGWTLESEAVLVEAGGVLERRIRWRSRASGAARGEEIHRVELLDAAVLVQELGSLGFEAHRAEAYGAWTLPGPRAAIIARGPR